MNKFWSQLKTGRGIAWVVFALIVVSTGVYSYYFLKPQKNVNGLYLVPKDAIFVVESSKPMESWNSFSKTDIWKGLQKQAYFSKIGRNAEYLDSLIHEHSSLLSLFNNGNLILSAHKTAEKDFGYIFFINLKKGTKIGQIEEMLDEFISSSKFRIEKSEFKNKTIVSAFNHHTKETLYFTMVQNYLLCSYHLGLIENSILELEDPNLGRQVKFLDVYKETSEDGICKLFISYKFLNDFTDCFLNISHPDLKKLSQSLKFSGFKVEANDEQFELIGNTNLNDSSDSYLRAFLMSGKGRLTGYKIIPNSSSIYHAYGFDNGIHFYKNLLRVRQSNEKRWEQFQKERQRIETKLNVKLERDFIMWVADEASIVYINSDPEKLFQSKVALIKTNSSQSAKKSLSSIEEYLNKKVSAPINHLEFKGYEVRHVELDKMLELFFGPMFSNLDKLFYTFIDKTLVLTANQEDILYIIDQYENGNTLSQDRVFSRINNEFNNESSLFSYQHLLNSNSELLSVMDTKTKRRAIKNAYYAKSFPHSAFQLTSKGDKFYTTVRVNYSEFKEKGMDDTTTLRFESNLVDTLSDYITFKKLAFVSSVLKSYYGNTDTLRYEVETNKGKKDGHYREFYKTGELKIFGNFRDGKKIGHWFNYAKDGSLLKKERFEVEELNID